MESETGPVVGYFYVMTVELWMTPDVSELCSCTFTYQAIARHVLFQPFRGTEHSRVIHPSEALKDLMDDICGINLDVQKMKQAVRS